MYTVLDRRYSAGKAYVLAEQRLEGHFMKWNNNAGKVHVSTAAAKPSLGAILEGDSDEEEDDDDAKGELVNDVPQCFSHFTYFQSNGRQLVCDLQGVWNVVDGFNLTDPVIHYHSERGRRHVNGSTDKGREGMEKFFETHQCGPLCRKLGLVAHRPRGIRRVVSEF